MWSFSKTACAFMFGQGLQRLCVATSEMCVFISIVNARLDYVLLFIGFWHFCMVRVTLLWHAQSNNVFYIFTWTMVFIKTVLVRERIKKQKQNILVLKNTVYKCVFTSFIYFSPYQLMSLIAETYSCSFYTQEKKNTFLQCVTRNHVRTFCLPIRQMCLGGSNKSN